MKKIITVALIIIILAGAGWYMWKKQSVSKPQQNNPSTATDIVPLSPIEEKTGVINSIKDAMGLGKKMACTYASIAGTPVSSTVFIDGQKIKTATVVNGETTYGIFDGDAQYTWTTGKDKQGFTMSKSCMDELKNIAPQTPSGTVPTPAPVQDSDSFDTAQNVNCVEAGGEDFSIPSDITFVDQCEMLRKNMKALEQMKQQLPSGTQAPVSY